jgi:hypothetical protein
VQAYEPYKKDAVVPEGRSFDSLNRPRAQISPYILVAHSEFKEISPQVAARQMKGRIVIDTVGILDQDAWRSEGFAVFRLGVSPDLATQQN